MDKTAIRVALCTTVLWLALPPASALHVTFEEGVLRASEGEETRWTFVLDARKSTDPKHHAGPFRAGDRVWFALGPLLYELDASSGTVLRCLSLPGVVKTFTADGETAVLEVEGFTAPARYGWTRTYHLGPDGHDIPFSLPGSGFLRYSRHPRQQAENVPTRTLERARLEGRIADVPVKGSWEDDPANAALLAEVLEALTRAQVQDPTNPWLPYERGTFLAAAGRDEEARAAFRAALDVAPEYRYLLLSLVFPLDQHDTALGQEAFDKALSSLLARGFEPEMLTGLIILMITYGAPLSAVQQGLDPAADLARMEQLGRRVWDLAPFAEGAAMAYNALASAHRDAGNEEQARVWRARRDAASSGMYFPGASLYLHVAGAAINVFAAAGIALWLLLVVKALRYGGLVRRTPKTGVGMYNPFAYWSKGEVAGFVLLTVAALFAGAEVRRGTSALAVAAAAPLNAFGGFPGHPDTLAFIDDAVPPGSPSFLRAFTRHKAGDLDEALREYASLDSARAWNNRGAILAARGDASGAQTCFEEALSRDAALDVALFNLGREVSSPAVERKLRYGATGPLNAVPDARDWAAVYGRPGGGGSVLGFFRLMGITGNLGGNPSAMPGMSGGAALTLTAVFFSLFALIALFQPRYGRGYDDRTVTSVAGWIGGFLVPGASARWWALGPFVLAAVLFFLLVEFSVQKSGGLGTNLLELVVSPGLTRAYGFGEPFLAPPSSTFAALRPLAWILLGLNVVVLAVLEWRRRDPGGPFGLPPLEDDPAADAHGDEEPEGEEVA